MTVLNAFGVGFEIDPTLSLLMSFMLDLTITRVLRSSDNILASRLRRTTGFTKMKPLGETAQSKGQRSPGLSKPDPLVI